MSRSVQQTLPPMPLEDCSPKPSKRTKDSFVKQARNSTATTERTKHSSRAAERTKDSPDASTILASELFDAAVENAKLTSADVAGLIGVSESLVNRMRSPNYRDGVSFVQMLKLPATFHWELYKALNKRHGYTRRALNELMDAAGAIALLVD